MRALICSVLLFFCVASVYAGDRNVGEPFRFTYTIIDSSGAHVTGQTATIKIQKASNGYWYDFADSTFKNSGWTNKTRVLTENTTDGFYYYTFTPPAAETAQEQYLFVVDNADATYGDHQALVVNYDITNVTVKQSRGR